jgi:DNA invertase Pin-like site-specific DNA recombinase
MTVYGYARVSTDGQTLDVQIAALKAVRAEKVYSEKQSGAKTDASSRAAGPSRAIAPLKIVMLVRTSK